MIKNLVTYKNGYYRLIDRPKLHDRIVCSEKMIPVTMHNGVFRTLRNWKIIDGKLHGDGYNGAGVLYRSVPYSYFVPETEQEKHDRLILEGKRSAAV